MYDIFNGPGEKDKPSIYYPWDPCMVYMLTFGVY